MIRYMWAGQDRTGSSAEIGHLRRFGGKGALSFLWTHWISGAGEKHAHMLGKQWDVRTWCPGQCRAGEAACGVARAEGH